MGASTRDRILEAAERLFAERGFDAVGIREITTLADCNVSAVNYYFGNKKGLYMAVFKERLAQRAFTVQETFRREFNSSQRDLRGLLRALARAYLLAPFSEEERLIHHRLLSREAHQPTEAFHYMLKEVLLPFFNEIKEEIKRLSRIPIPEDKLRIFTISVFAIMMHFSMARTMVSRLTGKKYTKNFLEALTEEIAEFCLNGLEGR
jgi:AcrR family transcriptional regulator